jgi:Ca-activated chloride channel homolog
MAAAAGAPMIGRGVTLALASLLAISPQTTKFRSGIDVVAVDVAVTRRGMPVLGLTAGDFLLSDNGVPQGITSARLDRLPLTVLLVLDVSGSVAGERLTHLTAAAAQLRRSLRPDDRILLLTFSQRLQLAVPLTTSVGSMDAALGRVDASGQTSLYDAVHTALQLRPMDSTRSLILVFTDGADNTSWLAPDAVIAEARRNDVVIHAIELSNAPGSYGYVRGSLRMPGPPLASLLLGRLTATTGGRVWSATSSRDLTALFTKALDEMRARYVLTFTPTGVSPTGWHDLKVTLKRGRADIAARPGYSRDSG